jgi:hypothetical protein
MNATRSCATRSPRSPAPIARSSSSPPRVISTRGDAGHRLPARRPGRACATAAAASAPIGVAGADRVSLRLELVDPGARRQGRRRLSRRVGRCSSTFVGRGRNRALTRAYARAAAGVADRRPRRRGRDRQDASGRHGRTVSAIGRLGPDRWLPSARDRRPPYGPFVEAFRALFATLTPARCRPFSVPAAMAGPARRRSAGKPDRPGGIAARCVRGRWFVARQRFAQVRLFEARSGVLERLSGSARSWSSLRDVQ